MKKYAYYPGCALTTLASEYDISFRNLCARMGIELGEVPGWICCGAAAACSSSRLLGVALPLKSIALAVENGYTDIVTPCSACFYHFKKALHEMETNPSIRRDAEDAIGVVFDRPIRVMHPLELFFQHVDLSQWKRAVVRDLSHLKVACYYGCLLTRPPKVLKFDNPEYPQTMDKLLRTVGVPTVDWSYKTDCCGAFYASINPEVVVDLTHRILENAHGVGANAFAVGCPICHLNLDARQAEVEKKYGTKYQLPVFYFTQLMGAAMGVDESGLGMWRHVVDPQPLMGV
ncbi:MAG: CoB--CoM heterodisulfide reductase iron-sulfur subunit B family protein [Acidobacteria bacterium]|nr:CoB--CoM heterodisulfide reductase iron-sulfur subunit B family protein [Acidobacteriota bacterium]